VDYKKTYKSENSKKGQEMMKRYSSILVCAVAILGILVPRIYAENETRIALVIGNNAYQSGRLHSPANDANDMSRVLKSKGFEVTLLKNVSQNHMKEAIEKFGESLKTETIGLFFFAGHGLQVNGENYLIPVGARIKAEDEIESKAVNVKNVLGKMESANNSLNMVFLDACRDNPLGRGFVSAQKGLVAMNAPNGTLIAFSTAPGETVSDGTRKNGLFTSHLLKYMGQPDLGLTQMMEKAKNQVKLESADKQVPWSVSSLKGDFFFSGEKGFVMAPRTLVVEKQIGLITISAEEELWKAIRHSKSIKDFEEYLSTYPSGRFAKVAEINIRKLKAVFDQVDNSRKRLDDAYNQSKQPQVPNTLLSLSGNKTRIEHHKGNFSQEDPAGLLFQTEGQIEYSEDDRKWESIERSNKFLFSGAIVKTGSNARASIIVNDGSVLEMGPNSKINVTKTGLQSVTGFLWNVGSSTVGSDLMRGFTESKHYTTIRASVGISRNPLSLAVNIFLSDDNPELVWDNVGSQYSYKVKIGDDEYQVPATRDKFVRTRIRPFSETQTYSISVLKNGRLVSKADTDKSNGKTMKYTIGWITGKKKDQLNETIRQIKETFGENSFMLASYFETQKLWVAAMDQYQLCLAEKPDEFKMAPYLFRTYKELHLENLYRTELKEWIKKTRARRTM